MPTQSQIVDTDKTPKERGESGKAKPASGLVDRQKDNRHGHAYGAKSHPIKRTKVMDAKERGAASVQAARAATHGKSATFSGEGNDIKRMAFIPSGADSPTQVNGRGQGHFVTQHGGAVKQISHIDD
jgi:hypothetical protein